MKNLKKKIGGGNGFTLVEMLIVVAIIAILIAISIPLVNNALDRAKHSTDAANERAAKAQILIQNMAEGTTSPVPNGFYDAGNGVVVGKQDSALKGYGKHGTEHKDKVIHVQYNDNGTVYMTWEDTTSTTSSPATLSSSAPDLCTSK